MLRWFGKRRKYGKIIVVLVGMMMSSLFPLAALDVSVENLKLILPEKLMRIDDEYLSCDEVLARMDINSSITQGKLAKLNENQLKAFVRNFLIGETDFYIAAKLLRKNHLEINEATALKILEQNFAKLPANEQKAFLDNLQNQHLSKADFFRQIAQNRHEQFRLVCAMWIETYFAAQITVSDAECEFFYRMNQQDFYQSPSCQLRAIAIAKDTPERSESESSSLAKKIYFALCQGASWEINQKEYNALPPETLTELLNSPEVQSAFVTRPIGSFELTATDDYWLIIQVLSLTPGAYLDFTGVLPEIKQQLKDAKIRQAVNQTIAAERSKSSIEILF